MITKIERLHLILLSAGAFVGWALTLFHAPSFLIGGLVMQVNFWLWKRIAGFLLFQAQRGRGKIQWAVAWVLVKGLLFLLLVSALFFRYPIRPGSFLLGVSLLLVTCMIVSLSGTGTEPTLSTPDEQKT